MGGYLIKMSDDKPMYIVEWFDEEVYGGFVTEPYYNFQEAERRVKELKVRLKEPNIYKCANINHEIEIELKEHIVHVELRNRWADTEQYYKVHLLAENIIKARQDAYRVIMGGVSTQFLSDWLVEEMGVYVKEIPLEVSKRWMGYE